MIRSCNFLFLLFFLLNSLLRSVLSLQPSARILCFFQQSVLVFLLYSPSSTSISLPPLCLATPPTALTTAITHSGCTKKKKKKEQFGGSATQGVYPEVTILLNFFQYFFFILTVSPFYSSPVFPAHPTSTNSKENISFNFTFSMFFFYSFSRETLHSPRVFRSLKLIGFTEAFSDMNFSILSKFKQLRRSICFSNPSWLLVRREM